MEKIRKAVIYARVSSEEQGDKYSLPAQLDLLRTYAINNSIEVVKEYVDEQISAVNVKINTDISTVNDTISDLNDAKTNNKKEGKCCH